MYWEEYRPEDFKLSSAPPNVKRGLELLTHEDESLKSIINAILNGQSSEWANEPLVDSIPVEENFSIRFRRLEFYKHKLKGDEGVFLIQLWREKPRETVYSYVYTPATQNPAVKARQNQDSSEQSERDDEKSIERVIALTGSSQILHDLCHQHGGIDLLYADEYISFFTTFISGDEAAFNTVRSENFLNDDEKLQQIKHYRYERQIKIMEYFGDTPSFSAEDIKFGKIYKDLKKHYKTLFDIKKDFKTALAVNKNDPQGKSESDSSRDHWMALGKRLKEERDFYYKKTGQETNQKDELWQSIEAQIKRLKEGVGPEEVGELATLYTFECHEYGNNIFTVCFSVKKDGHVEMHDDDVWRPDLENLQLLFWRYNNDWSDHHGNPIRFGVSIIKPAPTKHVEKTHELLQSRVPTTPEYSPKELETHISSKEEYDSLKHSWIREIVVNEIEHGKIKQSGVSWSGSSFFRDIRLKSVKVTRPISFRHCTIHGNLYFDDCDFLYQVDLSACKIMGDLIISNCRFTGLAPQGDGERTADWVDMDRDIAFFGQNARIGGNLDINRAEFLGSVSMPGVQVEGTTKFCGVSVHPLYNEFKDPPTKNQDPEAKEGDLSTEKNENQDWKIPVADKFADRLSKDPKSENIQHRVWVNFAYGRFQQGLDLGTSKNQGMSQSFEDQNESSDRAEGSSTIIAGSLNLEMVEIFGNLFLAGLILAPLNHELFATGSNWPCQLVLTHAKIGGALSSWRRREKVFENWDLSTVYVHGSIYLDEIEVIGNIDLLKVWVGEDLKLSGKVDGHLDVRSVDQIDMLRFTNYKPSEIQNVHSKPFLTLAPDITFSNGKSTQFLDLARTHIAGNMIVQSCAVGNGIDLSGVKIAGNLKILKSQVETIHCRLKVNLIDEDSLKPLENSEKTNGHAKALGDYIETQPYVYSLPATEDEKYKWFILSADIGSIELEHVDIKGDFRLTGLVVGGHKSLLQTNEEENKSVEGGLKDQQEILRSKDRLKPRIVRSLELVSRQTSETIAMRHISVQGSIYFDGQYLEKTFRNRGKAISKLRLREFASSDNHLVKAMAYVGSACEKSPPGIESLTVLGGVRMDFINVQSEMHLSNVFINDTLTINGIDVKAGIFCEGSKQGCRNRKSYMRSASFENVECGRNFEFGAVVVHDHLVFEGVTVADSMILGERASLGFVEPNSLEVGISPNFGDRSVGVLIDGLECDNLIFELNDTEFEIKHLATRILTLALAPAWEYQNSMVETRQLESVYTKLGLRRTLFKSEVRPESRIINFENSSFKLLKAQGVSYDDSERMHRLLSKLDSTNYQQFQLREQSLVSQGLMKQANEAYVLKQRELTYVNNLNRSSLLGRLQSRIKIWLVDTFVDRISSYGTNWFRPLSFGIVLLALHFILISLFHFITCSWGVVIDWDGVDAVSFTLDSCIPVINSFKSDSAVQLSTSFSFLNHEYWITPKNLNFFFKFMGLVIWPSFLIGIGGVIRKQFVRN